MNSANATFIVSVTDSFELKRDRAGSSHEPGVVAIFDGRQCAFQLPALDASVELLRPDGKVLTAVVAEIKQHGDGRSFFFRDLNKSDVPVATVIYWPAIVDSHQPVSAAGARST